MDEQALAQFLAALENGDPAALEAFAQMGTFSDKMAMGQQDYGTGLGMTQAPSAQGQNVGGTYVAANPLEHLSAAMTRVMGAKQMQDARTGQQANMDALTKAKIRMLQAMSQQTPQVMPGQPQAGMGQPGSMYDPNMPGMFPGMPY